jgi:hypothetical protein
MLDDAQRGRFGIVLAESLDRLSRDQEDIAGLYKRLSFAGVRIVTLSEGDINEMHIGFKGTMGALFLKDLADKKKEIFEDDLIALLEDGLQGQNNIIQFVSLQVQAGSKGPQVAEIVLNVEGIEKNALVNGNGPVDATFCAIREIYPHPQADLELYQVHAVTGGTDAQAEVSVRLREGAQTVSGSAADADTLVASARAYVSALNKLLRKRGSLNPQTASGDVNP